MATKTADFKITHPDKTTYLLTLPRNCTGQDCLNEVSVVCIHCTILHIYRENNGIHTNRVVHDDSHASLSPKLSSISYSYCMMFASAS